MNIDGIVEIVQDTGYLKHSSYAAKLTIRNVSKVIGRVGG